MQVGLITIPRGTVSHPHSHPNEQWTYVLKGKARVFIAGQPEMLGVTGTLIYAPANVVHSVEALPDEDLVFFTVKDLSHASWASEHEFGFPMEAPRRARRALERARHQHGADARHEPRRGDHPRARWRRETLGRDGGDPSQGQDRRAHHGPVESVIYVVSGRARMRWATSSSSPPRRGRATSSTCRRTSRTRKSTRATPSRCRACSAAAARNRWWSTSIFPRLRNPKSALGGQHPPGAEEVT